MTANGRFYSQPGYRLLDLVHPARSVTAEPNRSELLALIRRYGRGTTSFQMLEPGLHYWWTPERDACVAFADVGRAWVAAGPPLAATERISAVTDAFAAAAHGCGRRVRLFALESTDALSTAFTYLHMGEQPSWDPAEWPKTVAGKRSLREQLRRARAKGVRVSAVSAEDFANRDGVLRRDVDALIRHWLDNREMAPMGFVVQLELDTLLEERRIFVARHDGKVIGLLAAVPVYARGGWFFEDVLRHASAPNGTVELLFDYAMRVLGSEGSRYVTYGLAPLSRTPSPLLAHIRDLTRWLYHFEGLRTFKAKLLPQTWQPVYLAYPRDDFAPRAVVDVLSAFAGGSLWGFAWETLKHRVCRRSLSTADMTAIVRRLAGSTAEIAAQYNR